MSFLSFATMPDESLMSFIRAGNVRAFETLVNRHHAKFYRMTYRWVLNASDAEDIVQDAFEKLWSGKAKWQPHKKARFTTWFYRILHNQAVDVLRSRSRSHVELIEDIPSDEQSAEISVMEQQVQKRLRELLLELPDAQRIAVMLFYYEELPQKQMASIMGISVKALESLLSRAKATLKERMAGYGPSLYATG